MSMLLHPPQPSSSSAIAHYNLDIPIPSVPHRATPRSLPAVDSLSLQPLYQAQRAPEHRHSDSPLEHQHNYHTIPTLILCTKNTSRIHSLIASLNLHSQTPSRTLTSPANSRPPSTQITSSTSQTLELILRLPFPLPRRTILSLPSLLPLASSPSPSP
ncbi:hypothetical protein BD414DRAFT_529457 [Trametes punicea]|nr:hypothetical protein BD414DRAFT_529457 [Trametes punicea]